MEVTAILTIALATWLILGPLAFYFNITRGIIKTVIRFVKSMGILGSAFAVMVIYIIVSASYSVFGLESMSVILGSVLGVHLVLWYMGFFKTS